MYTSSWYTRRKCRHDGCNLYTVLQYVGATVDVQAENAIVTFLCKQCGSLSAFSVPREVYFTGKPEVCQYLWRKEKEK
jgi:hypothetical protein